MPPLALEELAAELAKCPGELGPGTEPYARSSAGISTSSASANFRSPGHGNRGFPNRTGLDPNMDPNGGRGISRASKTEPRNFKLDPDSIGFSCWWAHQGSNLGPAD